MIVKINTHGRREITLTSVSDPYHFDLDPDPDPYP